MIYYSQALEAKGFNCIYLLSEQKVHGFLSALKDYNIQVIVVKDRFNNIKIRKIASLFRGGVYLYWSYKLKYKYSSSILIHASARPIEFLRTLIKTNAKLNTVFMQIPDFKLDEFTSRKKRTFFKLKTVLDEPFEPKWMFDHFIFKSKILKEEFEKTFGLDKRLRRSSYLPSPISLGKQTDSFQRIREKELPDMSFLFLATLMYNSGKEDINEYVSVLKGLIDVLKKFKTQIGIKVHPKSDVSDDFIAEHFPGVKIYSAKDIQSTMDLVEDYDFVVGNYSTLMRDSLTAGKLVLGWHGFKRFNVQTEDVWKSRLGEFYIEKPVALERLIDRLDSKDTKELTVEKYQNLDFYKQLKHEMADLTLDDFNEKFYQILFEHKRQKES